MEPAKYLYSYKFSVATMVLMVVMMLLLFTNVMAAHSFLGWVIYSFFCVIFLFMEALLIWKRLVPAIYHDIALQIDSQGISDYIRDVSINWVDIKEITLTGGRSASSVQLLLKWESEYGKLINIPLRWVKGKDDEIYNTVLLHFESYKNNTAL